MKMFIAIALGTACAGVVVACGGAARPSSRPAGPMPSVAGASDARAQIEELDQQITAKLGEMNLSRPAPAAIAPTMAGSDTVTALGAKNVTSAEDAACRPAQNDTCGRSCTLADSICTNASRICKLAEQLPDDPWAHEKCAGNTASCHAAHDSCCSCT
ncbi:MAG: hypothetical protein KF773_37375 [Deltaproteobacteria bacterium]|nr:hypothetical protein [Deltaproteobacteria bacterium]